MNITLKDATGNIIEINGQEYKRTMIYQTAHGICQRFAQTSDSRKTVTLRKDRMMKSNTEVARILFDARNWN